MKVLALNSSPRTDKGNTHLVLAPFLDGMKEAGADIELIYTKRLKVNPCQGEYTCWLRTPGVCFQNDDMQTLLPKIKDADILVLGTPVYVAGVSGSLKMVIDRCIPLGLPFFEYRDGHYRHVMPEGHKRSKVVLVSSCGFWELDNFDSMLNYMDAACKHMDKPFVGALLRPHVEALRYMAGRSPAVEDVYDAAKAAGRQLISEGAMAPETLARVSQEIVSSESYLAAINKLFRRLMDQHASAAAAAKP